VTPLREGGSLPGVVEADDDGIYVTKFRGAGQGLKELVAEVVVGELARRLRLRTPELRVIQLDAAIGRYEADEEVQDLLTASVGLNLAVDFLPGSFGWDASCPLDSADAARILWLDAFTANVDRSWRNPNLLVWHDQVWLIDHGASLYFHHSWASPTSTAAAFAEQRYDATDHVLIERLGDAATELSRADADLAEQVTPTLLADTLAQVPDEWLEPTPGFDTPAQVRRRYVEYLLARVRGERRWLPREPAR